jgi:hypothetical protein
VQSFTKRFRGNAPHIEGVRGDVRSCRAAYGWGVLCGLEAGAHCQGMMRYSDSVPISASAGTPAGLLQLAAAGYLARFTGSSREHTQSGLRCYWRWCAGRRLDPLAARRPDLELYIRWMQETCRFKPSAISRRFSVAAGSCRTCVTDGVLGHSPAGHVRRPHVTAESPTLGFTRLRFEALLTAAREPADPYDFALVAMLGLLGLRIFTFSGFSKFRTSSSHTGSLDRPLLARATVTPANCESRAESVLTHGGVARDLPAETARWSTITQIFEGINQTQRLVISRDLARS